MANLPPLPAHVDVVTDAPLAAHTNLGVGGPARWLARPKDRAELQALLAWARATAVPVFVLGGGTNVVVSDAGFAGLVLRLPPPRAVAWPTAGPRAGAGAEGYARDAADEDATVLLEVDGGTDWDAFCRASVAHNLAGMECMVGIPGTLGAAPLQNVGAYGQEFADVVQAIEVLELESGEILQLPATACGFGYRTSHFKRAWQGRHLVLAMQVRLRLQGRGGAWPRHAGLRRALASEAGQGPAPRVQAIAAAVLELRRQKAMVVDAAEPNSRSVGSFFVNPVLPIAQARALQAKDAALTGYPAPAGTKVSAAALIERAGLGRGHRFAEADGRVGLSAHHTLALVNVGGARGDDVVAAARAVRARVLQRFGVALEAEPRFVGFADAAPYL